MSQFTVVLSDLNFCAEVMQLTIMVNDYYQLLYKK